MTKLEAINKILTEKLAGTKQGKTLLEALNYVNQTYGGTGDADTMADALEQLYAVFSKGSESLIFADSGAFTSFTSSIKKIDYSNIESGIKYTSSSPFKGMSSLEEIKLKKDLVNGTAIRQLFMNCSALKSVDFNGLALNYEDVYQLFYGCSTLTNIDWSDAEMTNTKSLDSAFYSCSSITNIDLSQLGLNNLADCDSMFYDCTKLESVKFPQRSSGYSTSAANMFYNCTSLKNVDWEDYAMKITVGSYTFYGCSSLEKLAVDKFSTTTYMSTTFTGCSSLSELSFGKEPWAWGALDATINFKDCPLNHDSVITMFSLLRGGSGTLATGTITFSEYTKSLLTEDEIKIATDKGWTIS